MQVGANETFFTSCADAGVFVSIFVWPVPICVSMPTNLRLQAVSGAKIFFVN